MEHGAPLIHPGSAASAYRPVAQVRRLQREIALGPAPLSPPELLALPAWQDTAQFLTRYHFHQWVRKDLEAVEVIEQIYRHLLYWFPIVRHRLPWTYGPGWHRGTVVGWLQCRLRPPRRLALIELPERGPQGLACATENARAAAGLSGDGVGEGVVEWVEASLTLLWRASQGEDLVARLAALGYQPFAYADLDRAFNADCAGWGATTSMDYLRLNRYALLVDDAQTGSRRPDLAWIDLCEDFAEVLDYRLRYRDTGAGPRLEVTLKPAVLDAAKARLRHIVEVPGSAAHRLRLVNEALQSFEARHRWDAGLRWQFQALAREAQALVRRHILPDWPQARSRLHSMTLDTSGPAVEAGALLDPEAPEADWVRLFSPHR